MKSKTHIIILHMKEIIYTIIFAVLALVLVFLLVYMFGHKKDETTMAPAAEYNPGIYTSTIVLGDSQVDVAVTVDKDHINSVSFVDLKESVKTMYPLLETCIEDISKQLSDNVPLNQVAYSTSNQYTVSILLEAINSALQKAAP